MTRKKMKILISSILGGLCLAVFIGLFLTGYYVGWGPFSQAVNIRYRNMAGNAERYSAEKIEPLEDSPLKGMNIAYLGPSVTYGAASLQESFVEFIAKKDSTTYVKEAVSGTTLSTLGTKGNSYVTRMSRIDKEASFDFFVCQLSTNDASQNIPLGNTEDTDTATVCGAINTIIDYARATWNCRIVFYTNPYYESDNYSKMVTAMQQIAEEKKVGLIDLYTDQQFNDITGEQRKLYMADRIHPTKAGYLKWWTPKMEQYLYDFLGKTK